MSGDVILKINDKSIYFMDDYYAALRGQSSLNLSVLRGNEVKDVVINFMDSDLIVVSSVFPDSVAFKNGFLNGDVIRSVNGHHISVLSEVVEFSYVDGRNNSYEIVRNGELMKFEFKPDDVGHIGVGLAVKDSYKNYGFSVYAGDVVSSVLKIDDVRYSVLDAPIKAVSEVGKLSVLTAYMFVDVVKTLTTKFVVPQGVAGPVGIAQMTSVFMHEGFMSVLRFMALLSLSLGIINIFPLPALDGGR